MAALTRYSNVELLDLPDCGGLRENGKCSWLKVPICIGARCPYCKDTNSNKNNEKARLRLQSLDEETQTRIALKYYGGTRPWANPGSSPRR